MLESQKQVGWNGPPGVSSLTLCSEQACLGQVAQDLVQSISVYL